MASLMPLQRSVTPWKVNRKWIISDDIRDIMWHVLRVCALLAMFHVVSVFRRLLRFDLSVRMSSCPLWITPALSSPLCSKVIGWDCTGESLRCKKVFLLLLSDVFNWKSFKLDRKFFRSPNFDGWYRHRHKEMTQKLESLHLEVICDAVSLFISNIKHLDHDLQLWNIWISMFCLQNLLGWTKDKSEVEIVDLVLKLREKLVRNKILSFEISHTTSKKIVICNFFLKEKSRNKVHQTVKVKSSIRYYFIIWG